MLAGSLTIASSLAGGTGEDIHVVAVVLLGATLAASFIPAWRAATMTPTEVLRQD